MHRPAKKTKWNELRHDQGRGRHRGALLILGLHSAADAESSGVADALSRPDALAEELVGWGCSLGEAGAAATPPSVSAPKHDATDDERADSENRAMGAGTNRSGSSAFCGSRKAMKPNWPMLVHMAHAKEFEKSPTAPDYRPTTTDSNHSRVHPCTEQKGIISDSAQGGRHFFRGGRDVRTIATGAVSIRARAFIVLPSRLLTPISSSRAALGTIRYNPRTKLCRDCNVRA